MTSSHLMFLAAALVMGAASANGSPITFTETDFATGSLGSEPFSSSITLTAVGNTANVVSQAGGNFMLPATLSINIASLGVTANLTDAAAVFSCQNCSFITVGIEDTTVGSQILATGQLAFQGYGLTTTAGPLVGFGYFSPGVNFATNMGPFHLSSIDSPVFGAVLTPEPVSMVLFGLGVAGLGALKRSKRFYVRR